MTEIGSFGLPSPAPQGDADGAGLFGTKLKPPGGRHVEAGDFADHGAEPAVPQAFLHASKQGLVVAGFSVDDPVGCQACLRQSRREQVGAWDHPQDLASSTGGDPGGEKRRGCGIDRTVAAAGDLMQGTERQPATRKPRVEVGDAKGQTDLIRRLRPSIFSIDVRNVPIAGCGRTLTEPSAG